jgi:hypothetical protein
MKYFCFALFFLCFILLGCGRNDKLRDADVLRIDVEFESRCSVLANGVRYDFDGLSTASLPSHTSKPPSHNAA